MKLLSLFFILVVNSFYIWDGVDSYDPLDSIIDGLILMRRQKDEVAKDPSKDSFAVYEKRARIYADEFIDYLKSFNDSSQKISMRFKALSSTTWLGHYLSQVHLSSNLTSQMLLSGTAFETLYSEIISKKNLNIMRKLHKIFSNWFDEILDCSVIDVQKSPQFTIDNIRDLFIGGQLILADSNDDKYKRFGLFFIYFYSAMKRIKGTLAFYKHQITLTEYTNLVNKYIVDQTGGLEYSYISSKIKVIKDKLEANPTEAVNEEFNDVSSEFINLYYNILEKFASRLDVKSIDDQYKKYIQIYESKKDEPNYQIIQDGHKMLLQLFGLKKRRSMCC